jgi:transposase
MSPCAGIVARGSRTCAAEDLPPHLKAQILRELDRLELLLAQIKAVEAERECRARR